MTWLDGLARPDHGPGFRTRLCATCGAGWVGHVDDGDDWCPWCERSLVRQQADERRLLLDPPWLRRDAGRYDELSETDRLVWDRTRGQFRGAQSVETWELRLARAVAAGLITETDANKAITRVRG